MQTPILRNAFRITIIAVAIAAASACSSNPKVEPLEPDQALVRTPAPIPMTASSRGPVLTLEDVQFDFEQASLRAESATIVRQAADYLQRNPERIALVEGHTDTTGDAPYNEMLSEARSSSVMLALIDAGVPANRIAVKGFGETRPVANNGTLEGRQKNRRVEIIFKRQTGI